jgi:hypothetical protein
MRLIITALAALIAFTAQANANFKAVDLLDFIPDSEEANLLTTGVVADQYLADAIAQGDGTILLPRGKLKLNQTVHLKRRIHLLGQGGGMYGVPVTQFILAAPNITGFVVHRHNTGPNGLEASTTGADGSILEGFHIQGTGTVGRGCAADPARHHG